MSQDRLITADELAFRIRRSRKTVDRLRRAKPPGFPPEYNLSPNPHPRAARPLFKESEVEAWIAGRAE